MKKFSIIGIISIFLMGLAPGVNAQSAFEKIKPYGNLYMFFGSYKAETYTISEDKKNDIDLLYRINEHSNLGFNFNYEKYKGVFELGLDDIESDNKVRVRKAFGEYRLGIYKIMIGQTWSPYVHWSHEMADYYRSEGFGTMYEDPNIQIKISFLGFYIDIMKPYVAVKEYSRMEAVNTPTSASTAAEEEELITEEREITTGQPLDNVKSFVPKFAAGYEFKTKNFRISGGGAANFYNIKDSEDVEFNKSWVYSYLFYLNSDLTLGKFMMNLSGGFCVNPANFGIHVQSKGNDIYTGGAAVALENIATGKYEIKDTWNIQAFAEMGYQITQKILIFGGYGFSLVKYPNPGLKNDLAMEYYLNCKINLAGLIALTPSFSYHDYMRDMDDKKEGNDIYGGILATVSYY